MGSHLVMPAGEGFELTSGLNDALELIKELTKQKGDKPAPLSAELLKQAKAVQFLHSRKAGLVFGRSASYGFSMAKVATNEDGTATWSAPCFLCADSYSIGATIGAQEASSMALLMTEKAATYLQTHGGIGSAAAKANLSVFKGLITDATLDAYSLSDVINLDVAEGILVDLSASVGALQVDLVKNGTVYGDDVKPKDILGAGTKKVPMPPGFDKLHAALNQVLKA